ncbi:MAG TPA: acyltransferase [Thermoanaerobaculia bacterium]|nr:acyltransferase [Thermoanaerobaculia bacterium]
MTGAPGLGRGGRDRPTDAPRGAESRGVPPLELTGAGRLPALDGLRGIAILLVMVYHFVLYGGWRPPGGIEWYLHRVLTTGWIGVDLFFVLSGFLITGILYEAKGGGRYFRSFYMRRVLRIFPLYYGFLACYFLFAPMLFPQGAALREGQEWYWTYLLNFDIASRGWPEHNALAHFWSLAVEEQFYLLWPLVVWAFGRRWLLRICVGCVLGAIALRVALAAQGEVLAAYVLMPTRIDSLAIGGWLALYLRDGKRRLRLAGWDLSGVVLGVCFIAAVLVLNRRLAPNDPSVYTLGFTVIALMFAASLHLALRYSPRWLTSRPLRLLGRYSYGLYVIHHPLIMLLGESPLSVRRLPRWLGSALPAQALVTLIAATLSLALAALSWHLWERPFLRLKRRFPYRPTPERRDRESLALTPSGTPSD